MGTPPNGCGWRSGPNGSILCHSLFWGSPFGPIMADLGLSRRHGCILAARKKPNGVQNKSVAHLGAVFGDFDLGVNLPECHPVWFRVGRENCLHVHEHVFMFHCSRYRSDLNTMWTREIPMKNKVFFLLRVYLEVVYPHNSTFEPHFEVYHYLEWIRSAQIT